MPLTRYPQLYAIAEAHDGYLTTHRARAAGIGPMTLVQMERRGVLERVSRGVYRLVHYPPGRLDEYREAVLWLAALHPSVEPVLSHETALVLHELSDVSPAHIHLTLPRAVRIQRTLPGSLVLHRADILPDERTVIEGLPVTTIERTLRDCHSARLGPALLADAITDALRKGLLTSEHAQALRAELR